MMMELVFALSFFVPVVAALLLWNDLLLFLEIVAFTVAAAVYMFVDRTFIIVDLLVVWLFMYGALIFVIVNHISKFVLWIIERQKEKEKNMTIEPEASS